MNEIPTPDYCSTTTCASIDGNNGLRAAAAAAALATAERDANLAKQADPLTADVDQVLAAGTALRRARVDHLRAEIAIRRSADSIFPSIAGDHAAALERANDELAYARRAVEEGLRELGFGEFLTRKTAFGDFISDGLILQSANVAPLLQRQTQLKIDAPAAGAMRQENKRAMEDAMQRLRQEFELAANGTPSTVKRRVALDPPTNLEISAIG